MTENEVVFSLNKRKKFTQQTRSLSVRRLQDDVIRTWRFLLSILLERFFLLSGLVIL